MSGWEGTVESHVDPRRRTYSREERHRRACLRAAALIRSLWEEKGSSHSRLVDDPIIPNDLVIVGRSNALPAGANGRREHVVPCRYVVEACHTMLSAGASDAELAELIREQIKIVLVTPEESSRLDTRAGTNARQHMPKGWVRGGDPFARLSDAGIAWTPTAT